MRNTELGKPEENSTPVISCILTVGCMAIAGVFTYVGIDAVHTGAGSEILSSVVDGGFAVGSTFVAIHEWPKVFSSRS